MELWAKIVIAIVCVLIFIYLLGFVLTLIFYRIFKRKLKNRIKALSLLLTEKRTVLMKIKDKLILENVTLDKNLLKIINSFPLKIDVISLTNESRNELMIELNKATNDLSLISKNKNKELFDSIKEIDDSIRQTIAIYNTNILGYNYWVNVFWYRYFFKLIKKYPISKME